MMKFSTAGQKEEEKLSQQWRRRRKRRAPKEAREGRAVVEGEQDKGTKGAGGTT
jgi:hypothetical protein